MQRNAISDTLSARTYRLTPYSCEAQTVTLMRGFELHGFLRRRQTATACIVPAVERERRRARLAPASPFPLVDLASRRVLDTQHGDPDTPPFAEDARRKILVIVEVMQRLPRCPCCQRANL
jgi:hypothetical protein